jgi:hypothetical protein
MVPPFALWDALSFRLIGFFKKKVGKCHCCALNGPQYSFLNGLLSPSESAHSTTTTTKWTFIAHPRKLPLFATPHFFNWPSILCCCIGGLHNSHKNAVAAGDDQMGMQTLKDSGGDEGTFAPWKNGKRWLLGDWRRGLGF